MGRRSESGLKSTYPDATRLAPLPLEGSDPNPNWSGVWTRTNLEGFEGVGRRSRSVWVKSPRIRARAVHGRRSDSTWGRSRAPGVPGAETKPISVGEGARILRELKAVLCTYPGAFALI